MRESKLSNRELEIIALVAEGFIDKEIADKLNVSTRTVQTHIRRIFLKLNARNRSHAVANYLRGLMSEDSMGLDDFSTGKDAILK